MTYIETEASLAIKGITESTLINYFTTINQEEFATTASLFAEAGELLAPFEKPLVGREKIAAYLTQEAKGMKLLPQQGIYETEADVAKYKILGKVKTSLFSVNVAWYFTLNAANQITTAKINLLASPQELLGLQNQGDR
ncbi:MAG: nuclear transport factor 2 family protein [Pleurocapsa sp.]